MRRGHETRGHQLEGFGAPKRLESYDGIRALRSGVSGAGEEIHRQILKNVAAVDTLRSPAMITIAEIAYSSRARSCFDSASAASARAYSSASATCCAAKFLANATTSSPLISPSPFSSSVSSCFSSASSRVPTSVA